VFFSEHSVLLYYIDSVCWYHLLVLYVWLHLTTNMMFIIIVI